MKKVNLKKRWKREVACMLSMTVLVSSLLISNAAASGCSHPMIKDKDPIKQEFVSYNEGSHTYRYTYQKVCASCGAIMSSEDRNVAESHSMYYTDAGHLDTINRHCYRFHCRECGFNKEEIIYCAGGSSHATP